MFYISDFCHLCLKDDKYLINLSEKLPENSVIASKLGACVSEVVSFLFFFANCLFDRKKQCFSDLLL